MNELPKGLISGADGQIRCWWHGGHPDYLLYHDEEWGHPVADEHRLFEKICLEGFQSGLSWLTVLRKRENFRKAFAGFDYTKVARYGEQEVEALLQDAGIIRHRRKIESTINNAQRACEMVEKHGSLANWFWQYEPQAADRPDKFDYEALSQLGKTPASTQMSKDLKKLGWSFVGPTTAYAFMQAMGMVNDHLEGCYLRPAVEEKRRLFERPG